MNFRRPNTSNGHICASGPRATGFAQGALAARLVSDDGAHVVYIRDAKRVRSQGIDLSEVNLINASVIAAGGSLVIRQFLLSLCPEDKRHDISVQIDLWTRESGAVRGDHARSMEWSGTMAQMDEIQRLCALNRQNEPGPIRTVREGLFSRTVALDSPDIVGFIAATGSSVMASPEFVEHHTLTIQQRLRNIGMDPDSRESRSTIDDLLRLRLPYMVYDVAMEVTEQQRGRTMGSQTLIDLVSDLVPGALDQVRGMYGGHRAAPLWWVDRWTTIDIVDAMVLGPRLAIVLDELLATAMRMRYQGDITPLLVFVEPGVLNAQSQRGIESLLRMGGKYILWVTLMEQNPGDLPETLTAHTATYISDLKIRGPLDPSHDGLWMTVPDAQDSHPIPNIAITTQDRLHGDQLVLGGRYIPTSTITPSALAAVT